MVNLQRQNRQFSHIRTEVRLIFLPRLLLCERYTMNPKSRAKTTKERYGPQPSSA